MVRWVVDTCVEERRRIETAQTVSQAVEAVGMQVYTTKYVPFTGNDTEQYKIPFGANDFVIPYGSVQFIKQMQRKFPKWFTANLANYKYSNFTIHYPLNEVLLNDDYILLPYGEFKRRVAMGVYWDKPIFIRPDAVTKSFAGFVIRPNELTYEISSLDQIQKPVLDEMVVVASVKEILGEYRFVIGGHRVIDGSQYQYHGKLDIRHDIESSCQRLATEIAESDFEPDPVYILDVACTDEGPKVIEINAINCSGLYACDLEKVIREVSKVVESEYFCPEQQYEKCPECDGGYLIPQYSGVKCNQCNYWFCY